ncbi:ABC transporter permease [Nocardioides sp. ChNu-153]|uniref:ABC transporter permease n=1 Tax=Nocardioides sp. ChNu-153 TaxID=2779364 RepID=UPI0026571DDA|nr:ABC transporter permease [Nocardioides sp. ChNu-153]MDN7119992.1 ABC transporter permease [Nocardioides sp. ChNu-153]
MSTVDAASPAAPAGPPAGDAPATADIARILLADPPPARPTAWSASVTFGWRAVLKIKHVPEQLFDVTLFPIMMTLMFTYLFGGALAGSTTAYLQFFLPGILVSSIAMITMYTGVSINTDIEKGVFDRFRTLPIWRPAPMVGYLLGDLLRYLIAAVVIVTMGLVLGFRPAGGLAGVAAGVAVLLVFCFAFSWVWTMFGLLLRSEKSVMGVSMMVLMPLTFLSSTYVDPATMPGWLEAFVEVNPITLVVDCVRSLCAGTPDAGELVAVAAVSAGFVAVFGPVTMRLYNRK